MTLRTLIFLVAISMQLASVFAADDRAVTARSAAYELAGAFSANDGYKLRDGFFSTELKGRESKIFTVNLYFGNAYWFCVATAPAVKKVKITLYDEAGKALSIQPYSDGKRVAAGLTATYSGAYYVKITSAEGNAAESSTVCLLYAYK